METVDPLNEQEIELIRAHTENVSSRHPQSVDVNDKFRLLATIKDRDQTIAKLRESEAREAKWRKKIEEALQRRVTIDSILAAFIKKGENKSETKPRR